MSKPPWVLVAGGFHAHGGMDKANAALARYLLRAGHPVHLVAHHVAADLAGHPQAIVHRVPRLLGSYLLGEILLGRRGRQVAQAVTTRFAGSRVVVNGGCCLWPDINWVHYVHSVWKGTGPAPWWYRWKNSVNECRARRLEAHALHVARQIVANSERTRRHLVDTLALAPERVHTVYLGADEENTLITATERAAAQRALQIEATTPVVLFVGALGFDHRKGLDTLLAAWQRLRSRPGWDAILLIAGGGSGLPYWRSRIQDMSLAPSVHLLGFVENIPQLLAAADLLVSPVRYEAYGLNVHEAICRGVPALVSACAGVAERYPAELAALLLPDPENAADLAERLWAWRQKVDAWKESFAPLSAQLRSWSWDDTAARIVALAEAPQPSPSLV